MLKVLLKEPPSPDLIVSTWVPLMPRVPIGPISTLKVSLAGKLKVFIVTDWSRSTLSIEKVGILPEAEAGEVACQKPSGTSKIKIKAKMIKRFIASSRIPF
jgi:hypothetical protein